LVAVVKHPLPPKGRLAVDTLWPVLPVKRLALAIRRFILKQQIATLRSDMLVTEERREYAQANLASMELWILDAHRRLRQMRANLASIERPDVLLREALRRE
jgi:hypothetical protein